VEGGSNVTLGTNAYASGAGLNAVYINTNLGGSIYQQSTDTTATSLLGNGGNDVFSFDNATLLGNDSVAGNGLGNTLRDSGGVDTIWIRNGDTINDSQFANVTGIEVLSLTGSNSVSFNPADSAQNEGLSTIYGGNGANTISVNYTYATSIYIQGGTAADSLIAGGSNDTLQGWSGTSTSNTAADKMTGGNGNDLFILGDTLGNAYGQSGSSPFATITDYHQGYDSLNLHNYGAGAADYSVATLPGFYNLEILHGSDVVGKLSVQDRNTATFLTTNVNYLS
jgi:Ca2+-binding RTX toxin-like protein